MFASPPSCAAVVSRGRATSSGQLGERLGELQGGKTVAFVCRSGARSARATLVATKAGLDAVNVSGGVIGWSRAGLPLAR